MYKLYHTGYPVAGRRVEHDEWKLYSTHHSLRAAHRKIVKLQSHLSHGSWDDHYMILAEDGHRVQEWEICEMLYEASRRK